MIRLVDLQVRVGSFHLRDISVEVPSGGYALIIGPTGSGKTTLLEAIAGHARLLGGRVFMHNEDVTNLPPERRGIGFVYQQYHLFPHLTVRNNISYGLTGREDGTEPPGPKNWRICWESRRCSTGRYAGSAAVSTTRRTGPGARSQANDPAPGRAVRRRRSIHPAGAPGELRQLHEREGITTLQVTHDFDEALRLGDLVAVLSEGRIAQSGFRSRCSDILTPHL